jgi:hypothetical protein
MRARGGGELDAREASTPWAAVVLGGGVSWWPVRWVGIGARLDGHAAVFRPDFHTEPSGVRIHRAYPVGLQALGGMVVRAP